MIVAITGGRDRTPSLAELERLAIILRGGPNDDGLGAEVLRHGACPRRRDDDGRIVGSTDIEVGEFVKARGLARVEEWPAAWGTHGRSAGPIRNRAMLDGKRDLIAEPATTLISFDGGAGTKDCRIAAFERGRVVLRIHAVEEPRPWNMHAGSPAGRLMYAGRSPRWGGPSPLANPFPVEFKESESRDVAADRILGQYKRWLWDRLRSKDAAVLEALRSLEPTDYVGCTCWPRRCHVEIVIAAWRWLRANA